MLTGALFSACHPSNSGTIAVQPFQGVEQSVVDSVQHVLEGIYQRKVIVLPTIDLPANAFTNVKTPRYRADSLLKFLKYNQPDSIAFTLGITTQDISTTKHDAEGKVKQPESKYKDWGIFGLGYRPGSSSVVSTYRLKTTNVGLFFSRLKKVSVHELGHNMGLKHCLNKGCVMQDAAESIRTIDQVELGFCSSCEKKIVK